MTRCHLLAALLLLTGAALAQAPPEPPEADTTVGVFYFPGWSQAERWHCIKAHPEAQHPLLGYYREGTRWVADWHIKWAREHGIGFFAFDYYTHDGAQMLEAALDDGFLQSRFAGEMRFCLNWCNHEPAPTQTAQVLRAFADLALSKYLSHPSYLTIDGEPVVMILAGYNFVRTLGVEAAREEFTRFEERCKEAGLGGLHLVFGEGGILSAEAIEQSFAAGVDGFFLYNYPYAGSGVTGPGTHAEETYAHLIDEGEKLWKHWRAITGERFWPTVMPGWDRRPWTKDRDLIRTGGTPELFADSLRRAKAHVDADNIVLIEAWNEWGEGSVLEPSVEHGYAYLEAVRDVFSPAAGPHEDAGADSLDVPAFDATLPRIDTWRFDYDAGGWVPKDLAGFAAQGGAVSGRSTNTDPQLLSPVTYLPSEEYTAAIIRMRLTPQGEGYDPKGLGQFFWSTIDKQLAGELSVRFEALMDGQWHDYRLDLAGHGEWRGLVDRLRLDPVDFAHVLAEIDGIRLLPAD